MGGALSLHPQQLRAPRWAAPLTPGGCGGRPGQGSAFLLELQLNHLQLGSPFLGEGGGGNHKKKKTNKMGAAFQLCHVLREGFGHGGWRCRG